MSRLVPLVPLLGLVACGDSTGPSEDAGVSECSTFAECGGPNNVQTVSFCEHCFDRPDTHVCEAGRCRALAVGLEGQGQLRLGFTVPSQASGARSVALAALLPVDGRGAPVTCARLVPGGPAVFRDASINPTNATTAPLNPPGDPSFAYVTMTSADPGSGRLVYLAVTSDVQGKGTLLAEGCAEGLEVRAGETQNVTLDLTAR